MVVKWKWENDGDNDFTMTTSMLRSGLIPVDNDQDPMTKITAILWQQCHWLDDNVFMKMMADDSDDDPTMRTSMDWYLGDNGHDLIKRQWWLWQQTVKMQMTRWQCLDDDDNNDDPTMRTSMLRSGLIGGDNGSPKLLTLGPAQPPQLENTNYLEEFWWKSHHQQWQPC